MEAFVLSTTQATEQISEKEKKIIMGIKTKWKEKKKNIYTHTHLHATIYQ